MKALVRVELTRLRWRRAVVLLVAACVLVPGLVWGAVAWNTRPVSAAELHHAQQLVDQQRQDPVYERELRKCEAKPGRYGVGGSGDVRSACEDMMLPQVGWFVSRDALDLDTERHGSGVGVAIVLTMLMLLLGTTFVGHDWNSGSMSNQLLFDPRRVRVWAAKGLVVLLAGLVVAGVVLAAYWTGLWALAEHRDVPIHDGVLSDIYRQAWRATLVAGFAGLGGYAMTMLFRSTVATLGVLFAVAIAGPLLITLLGFPGNERLMPQNNYAAIVLDGFNYFVPPDTCAPDACNAVRKHLGAVDGATYYGFLLLLAAIPSVLSFRRRDVP